jgi:hypothetical protein
VSAYELSNIQILYATLIQINRIAISPDKRYLATAGSMMINLGNPTVKLYDVQSNNPNPVELT